MAYKNHPNTYKLATQLDAKILLWSVFRRVERERERERERKQACVCIYLWPCDKFKLYSFFRVVCCGVILNKLVSQIGLTALGTLTFDLFNCYYYYY